MENRDKRIISILTFLLVFALLWLPYFNPSGYIGPEGILRLDQVILPVFALALAVYRPKFFRIPVNLVVVGLVLVVSIISLSIVTNLFLHDNPGRVGDFFDVVVWTSYVGLIIAIGGNLPSEISSRALRWILVLSTGVAIFGVLQSFDFEFAVEGLAPIYTWRDLRLVRLAPTATTSNPNDLAKMLALPLFFSLGLLYRRISIGKVRENLRNTVITGTIVALFSYVIIQSNSRSGLGAVVIGSFVLFFLLFAGKMGTKRQRRIFLISASVTIGLTLLVIIFVLELSTFRYLQAPLQDPSLQMRFDRWVKIIPIIRDQPLLGHGPSKHFLQAVPYNDIDSGLLAWLYHYGILGLVAYLLVVLGALKIGIQTILNRDLFEQQPDAWAAAVAIVAWFSGFTVSWTFIAIPQARRVFVLSLLVLAFLISINMDEESIVDSGSPRDFGDLEYYTDRT